MGYQGFILNFLILTFSLTIYIYFSCQKNMTFGQKMLVFYIWFISLMPMCLLPLEMNEIQKNQSNSGETIELLQAFWLIYYWLNFINGYFILPIFIAYFLSGYFRFKQKLIDAIWSNILFYLITIFLGFIAFSIAFYYYKVQLIDVQVFIPRAMNTLCFFIYSVLLCYGLFRLPGRLLRSTFPLKIHEKLIVINENSPHYYSLIHEMIQMYEVNL